MSSRLPLAASPFRRFVAFHPVRPCVGVCQPFFGQLLALVWALFTATVAAAGDRTGVAVFSTMRWIYADFCVSPSVGVCQPVWALPSRRSWCRNLFRIFCLFLCCLLCGVYVWTLCPFILLYFLGNGGFPFRLYILQSLCALPLDQKKKKTIIYWIKFYSE